MKLLLRSIRILSIGLLSIILVYLVVTFIYSYSQPKIKVRDIVSISGKIVCVDGSKIGIDGKISGFPPWEREVKYLLSNPSNGCSQEIYNNLNLPEEGIREGKFKAEVYIENIRGKNDWETSIGISSI